MKLIKVRITDFQSIQDSTEIDIGDVTCFVGKNESGKTALLKALHRLNPVVVSEEKFDQVNDYPRRAMAAYKREVEANRREPAEVVQATFELDLEEVSSISKQLGPKCLLDDSPVVTLHKGYSNRITYSGLNIDNESAFKCLVESADLPQSLSDKLLCAKSASSMFDLLNEEDELTDSGNLLVETLQEISTSNISDYVCSHILHKRVPKFLYFDEFYQLKGQDNLNALYDRDQKNNLQDSDYPLLGLINLAGLTLEEILNVRRTEELRAYLEAAENQLTGTALAYWSQNRHLSMEFDIHEAYPDDPPGMTGGKNLWGRIRDTKHNVTTPLSTRSKGFVWFFSFLAWYSYRRKLDENLILLLDEPGLSLHAKAQADLLHYFETELIPYHQLIYTTHSPFMVDPKHFERVRIVQDLSIEKDTDNLPEELLGTRVITELHSAREDSLFPLQGALGYGITQSLFVGPNCLVVEGISDYVYLQTISTLLEERGKAGLSDKWTITPVGGSAKIPVFVALLGAQQDLNVAVLLDFQKKDQQSIDFLFESKLRRKKQVLTYAEFTQGKEADIEDMFAPEFYLDLVNREFGSKITLNELSHDVPRIVRRLTLYLNGNPLPNCVPFSHLRPANYLSNNTGLVKENISEEVFERFENAFKAINELL